MHHLLALWTDLFTRPNCIGIVFSGVHVNRRTIHSPANVIVCWKMLIAHIIRLVLHLLPPTHYPTECGTHAERSVVDTTVEQSHGSKLFPPFILEQSNFFTFYRIKYECNFYRSGICWLSSMRTIFFPDQLPYKISGKKWIQLTLLWWLSWRYERTSTLKFTAGIIIKSIFSHSVEPSYHLWYASNNILVLVDALFR